MLRAKFLFVMLFAGFLCIAIANFSYAGVPQLINYNGTLSDTGGLPVPDGEYDVTFSIYDVPTGGSALWTETWNASTTKVITFSGNFNAILGSHVAITASFFADHPAAYLGVKVGADSEMLPRQRIVSVGYAFTAGDGVPKGGIIMWSGSTSNIPAGWALCDGANGTPNLRDRFVVGAGSGYAVGATGGEASHTLTAPEMPSHTHVQNAHNHAITDPKHTHSYTTENNDGQNKMRAGTNGGGTYGPYSSSIIANTTGISVNNQIATNQNTGGGTAHENRPPYYALAFIMKL